MSESSNQPVQKRVTISSKRQFTIPQKFFTDLGFGKDAICTMGDGFMIIQPVNENQEAELSEKILADLIAEGWSGTDLLNEFKRRRSGEAPSKALGSMFTEAQTKPQEIPEDDEFLPFFDESFDADD